MLGAAATRLFVASYSAFLAKKLPNPSPCSRHYYNLSPGLHCFSSDSSGGKRLEYQHGYHAGNYADVIKHSIQIMLLERMKRKSSPFIYVDTHAGAGSYPLQSRESQQMNEFQNGIGRIMDVAGTEVVEEENGVVLPDPLSQLLKLSSRATVGSNEAPVYPGSPMIAQLLCRPQDNLVLFENASDQFDRLQSLNLQRSTLFQEDGYKGLAQYAQRTTDLPRALVFCDPPYQHGSDSERASRLARELRTHWRSARLALWHPASEKLVEKTERMWSMMREATDADVLAIEVYPNDDDGAVGTGMILVSPPFGIEEELRSTLPKIAGLLQHGAENGRPIVRIQWL